MNQSFRMMLIQAIFASLLFIGFGPVADVMGSLHRVRVDLKIRSPDILKEKAEAMSKPFPHRGNPLSWAEVIEIAGRTKDEIKQLVTKLSKNLNGKNIKECPSKQCIVADVDVDDEQILEEANELSDGETSTDEAGVEDFVDRRLRRLLEDSGHDHTIISGVRRISMPDDEDDYLMSRRHGRNLIDANDSDDMEPTAKENLVFTSIVGDIFNDRREVTKKSLSNTLNYLQFLVIPAICAFDNATGYYSMEKAQSRSRSSCPTQIKLTVSPWYAEDLAVSENITYTIFTEDLEKTEMCSDYNATTCKNSLETNFPFPFSGAIGIYGGYSEDGVIFKFRNNTVLRILEIGQFLDPGIAYYNIQVEYPEWGILTNATITGTVYSGPMITPAYGKQVYNVPEGHQGSGLGVTALGNLNAFSKDSLSAFLTGFDLPVPEIQLFESSIFQGNNLSACYPPGSQQSICSESNLDVQSITSYGVGAEFGFIPSSQQQTQPFTTIYEVFVAYREAFIENDVTPDVLSLSYGNSFFSNPEDFDNIAMEFTAVGITVLAASGDRGAAGTDFQKGPCSPTDYYPRGAVLLPAGSPWILSVGATMEADLLELDGLGPAACMAPIGGQITSSGLIQPSEAVELPDYQKAAVEGYLNSDAYKYWPFQASFSGKPGRGVPDVAAYGNNIPNVAELKNGELQAGVEGGTSASSPAFAGLLLQVRGALLSSPECEGIDVKFGHINPMIYWAAENRPDAFIDITVGNNVFDGQGTELDTAYCGFGYVATEGWDPVTGVGMMNFPRFVEAAKEYYCTGF